MDFMFSDDQLDEFTNSIIRSIFTNYVFNPYTLIQSFPSDIAQYMTDDLISDINDMGECFKNSLYTPGMLMAFRIFEKSINTHLEDDLKIEGNNKLHKSIQHLNKSFSKDFVGRLQKIRKIRNKTTHSDKVFEKDESTEILDDIMWVVLFVFNIVPDE